MINSNILTMLTLFIPTFALISITPGMCMTLSLVLGMTIGVKRTMWMMLGELIGVASLSLLSVLGVASVMIKHPNIFLIFKTLGAVYLIYLGVNMWRAKGKLSLKNTTSITPTISRRKLFMQGLFTALSNPKGWAFMVAFLPPFINAKQALMPQLIALLIVIITIEFISLTIYATGGKSLAIFLTDDSNVKIMNRVSASVMIGMGVMLILS